MMRVWMGVVRGSIRAGVNAAVGRRPLEITSSSQAVGLCVTLVPTGASTCSHFIPFVTVTVAPAGSCAGQSVTAGVTRVRAVRLPEQTESGRDEGGFHVSENINFPFGDHNIIKLL